MKQAILIIAHKDLFSLQRIISHFDGNFDFYIHIDKKCKEKHPQFQSIGKVVTISKHRVEWGSEGQLWAIYDLLAIASTSNSYSYYHIITGSDYPIRSCDKFLQFFSEDKQTNYIEYHPMPRDTWGKEGGLDRLRYYWIGNQWMDIRTHGNLTKFLVKVQRKTGIHRDLTCFGNLYCGGAYCSLSRQGVATILNFPRKQLHQRTRFTHACEEIILQTLLLNSKDTICENNSLRYILWEGNAASPKTLTEEDFTSIKDSDAFFARKIDPIASQNLISLIDTEFLNHVCI